MASILEDEIVADPLFRGYSGLTDAQLLTSLNTADRSRNRTEMTGREVAANIVDAEYDALSDAKKSQFLELIGRRGDSLSRAALDPFGFPANVVKNIFGSGSTTVSNLATARVETISRGVEIGWGVVTTKDLRQQTLSRKVAV